MTFLPVVAREMSALARRRGTYLSRAASALLALLVIGWLFLVALAGFSFAQLGRTIFLVLASLSFVYALLAGIHATSDSVSEEKREGTLGLLFLTDLKGYDIVLGKLAATSLNSIYALVGLVPMLSLAMLLGAVTVGEVAKVSLVLGNTMFFSLALGMYISARSENERKAMFAACVVLFVLTVAPYLITLVLAEFQSLPTGLLWISPLYPFLCLTVPLGKIPGTTNDYFYVSLLAQHFLGWLLLLRAASVLPKFIGGPATGGANQTWFDNYVFGRREKRAAHRTALLDRNAFLWLAGRERAKPMWAWVIVGMFFALYVWVAYGFHGVLFDLRTSCAILFLVHLILKFWLTSEVCSRLIQDRRSGALELLLTSPLSVRKIESGQHLALRRIFAGPVIALVSAEIVLMFLSLTAFTKPLPADRILIYGAGMTTLLLDFWALKWVGLWLSLFGKSMERVLIGTVVRVLLAPWLAFIGLWGVLAALADFQGEPLSIHQMTLLWWICGITFSLGFAIPARRKFFRHFREIAANRYESPAAVVEPELEKSTAARRHPFASWGRRHPIPSGLTAAALLVMLGVLAHRVYWEREFSKRIDAVKAQRQPTKLLELSAFYPPVPERENAFIALKDVGVLARPLGASPDWNLDNSEFLHRLDVTNRRSYEAIVTNNQEQLAALLAISKFTNAYFEPVTDYSYSYPVNLYGFLNLGLADLMLALDENDSTRMEQNLEALLKLARLARAQPLTYPQTLSFASLARMTPILEVVSFRDRFSDEALRRLHLLAAEVDSSEVLARRLVIDRALALDLPQEMHAALLGGGNLAPAKRRLAEAIGLRQKHFTRMLALYEEGLDFAQGGQYERCAWAFGLDPLIYVNGQPPNVPLDKLHEGAIREAIFLDARVTAQARLLQTAFAMQRYLRKHRAFPASLESLVPEFLSAVPADPFSNGPLRWKLTSDGAALYSLGPDMLDDGGTPFRWQGNGDLIFHFWRKDDVTGK